MPGSFTCKMLTVSLVRAVLYPEGCQMVKVLGNKNEGAQHKARGSNSVSYQCLSSGFFGVSKRRWEEIHADMEETEARISTSPE